MSERNESGQFKPGHKGLGGRKPQRRYSQWAADNQAELEKMLDLILQDALDQEDTQRSNPARKMLLDRVWPLQQAANQRLQEMVADLEAEVARLEGAKDTA